MHCTKDELEAFSKDSSYHDLGTLPSLGIPYGDKEIKIYVRPFRMPELRMLSKAVELGEMLHLMRAVDNVITLPVESLTIGDFFYVLLWLRIYSMPKSPYVVEWKCDQPYFTHKETKQYLTYQDATWPSVEELRTLYNSEPCNTENTSIVHQSDVEVLALDENLVLPFGFDFPRMSIYVDRAAALKDPEMALLAPAIQWLVGETWADKVTYANNNPEAVGEALDLNRKVVHGIGEAVTFQCRKCRVEHTSKVELNALSFFR